MTTDPSNGSAAAPVELFSTSILGNHKVRSRHERFISVLTIKKIPFVYHDLASDEDAKSRWRRKVSNIPANNVPMTDFILGKRPSDPWFACAQRMAWYI